MYRTKRRVRGKNVLNITADIKVTFVVAVVDTAHTLIYHFVHKLTAADIIYYSRGMEVIRNVTKR